LLFSLFTLKVNAICFHVSLKPLGGFRLLQGFIRQSVVAGVKE